MVSHDLQPVMVIFRDQPMLWIFDNKHEYFKPWLWDESNGYDSFGHGHFMAKVARHWSQIFVTSSMVYSFISYGHKCPIISPKNSLCFLTYAQLKQKGILTLS